MQFIKNISNENYAAVVVKPSSKGGFKQVEGLDNLLAFHFLGHTALCSKELDPDKLYLFFTSETQLDPRICFECNLYSDKLANNDSDIKGYLGKNRRVRAVKFRGNESNAMLLPVEQLKCLGYENFWGELKDGDSFTEVTVNHIDGNIDKFSVCCKYVPPVKESGGANIVKKSLYEEKLFPQHSDTLSIMRKNEIPKDSLVVITQKLHGTSARLAHQRVNKPLTWREKVAKFFGVDVQEHKYAVMVGSRSVVKEVRDLGKEATALNVWMACLQEYEFKIPKNYVVYGEIVGWWGNKPIQKKYTYDIPVGDYQFFVYRVQIINEDGVAIELDWADLREFCRTNGFTTVPELKHTINTENLLTDLDEEFMNKRLADTGYYVEALPLEVDKKLVDEGICIRADNPFKVQKMKSSIFLGHETAVLDEA